MSDQTILRASFVSESAAFRNTFGWYNSSTGLGGSLFANADSQGAGALTPGVSQVDFAVNTADLGKIQCFRIPAGAAQGRNEPAELPRIAAVLAQLRGMTMEELAQASTRNALDALPGLSALLSSSGAGQARL